MKDGVILRRRKEVKGTDHAIACAEILVAHVSYRLFDPGRLVGLVVDGARFRCG